MNCFNHNESPAIAFCKQCGKGLCKECVTETPNGVFCKGACGHGASATRPTAAPGTHRFAALGLTVKVLSSMLVIAAAIVLAAFIIQAVKQANADSADIEDLETRIEKGVYNTPSLDTLLFRQRKIYFSNDINELTCSWLVKQLLLLAGTREKADIDLYLCSSGGNIADAKAACNVIRSLGVRVNIFASGFCASSGVRILAAGTGTRAAYENTVFMFHGQDLRYAGKDHSYDAVAKELDIKEWRSMTDIPESTILDTSEVYWTPQEALKLGVIDTVLALPEKKSGQK